MGVKILNKNIPNNGMKETATSCVGLSLGSLEMEGKVPGGRNQTTTNTPLNALNEDNVMVVEEEWDNLFGNSMEIASFNGFLCELSNEDDININHGNKERQTWRRTFNTSVVECYFLSRHLTKRVKQ